MSFDGLRGLSCRLYSFRLPSNLESILDDIVPIKNLVTSKRKRHKLVGLFWYKSHTATIQKCRDELDWAMKEFDVSAEP